MKTIIQDGSSPIKLWTEDIEPGALEQLKNIARLPFIHPHGIAAMPDVHYGIGATVGSVIPAIKAIIPAAVGVDIGCFTGDTKVVVADGKNYRIDCLAKIKKPFAVYSCRANGEVVAAYATAKKTRKNSSLVKVILDNEQEIRCTPDHQFQLRDGTYRAASLLSEGDSLMPFYSKIDDEGYVHVKRNDRAGWKRAHWIVADSGLLGEVPKIKGQRTIIHHEDFCGSNNAPSNLEFMGHKDHSRFHRGIKSRNKHWQSKEFEANRKAAIRKYADSEHGRKELSERGTRNILKHMNENRADWLKSVSGNGLRGKSFLVNYNSSDKGRNKSSEVAKKLLSTKRECPDCGTFVDGHLKLFQHRRSEHLHNHKVLSVKPLRAKADVYCLTVPAYHNFALAAGVFVHNCGMQAVQTSLNASDLPDSLATIRHSIERGVPLGAGGKHKDPKQEESEPMVMRYEAIWRKNQKLPGDYRWMNQIGTLGSGNHFIELCLDESKRVWVMLHSGSRGIGNQIGRYFIEKAKRTMEKYFITLPDQDLAYFAEDTKEFEEYIEAVRWAQDYALANRDAMMAEVIRNLRHHIKQPFDISETAISCHHNYVEQENHFNKNVWITRKGAIRAREGDMGIIPGSMGQRSYIVRGLGSPSSYHSCSHGAGRAMGRKEARRRFTIEDLQNQTAGVECRKDDSVLDEIPGAYKDIDQVMANQRDLVEVVHTLKQVLCVKGN